MFKRSEKKIKAVFKMQFQVTQVPQMKAKGLMISLVPVDVGKPTVRLPKAPITEGACTWENPVYEAVKLVKEIKTGRIREKFYYLIVSTGSSKSGFLGEVSVDFADLAEANKPLKLTLPLQTSKSGAILHVTVQRIQGDPNSRYVEDDLLPMNESEECLDTELNDCYNQGKRNIHSSESEGSSEATSREQNGSLGDAESDNNDHKSANGMIEASDVKLGQLKNKMQMLERKAEVAEMEAQSLRQQIMNESKKGQKLSEQMIYLKQDRDALKAECEKLKSSSKCKNVEDESFYVQKETANMRSPSKCTKESCSSFGKKMDHNEDMKALEYLVNNLGNDAEIQRLKQDVENLIFELEIEKKEKAEIQIDLERLKLDYECLETEHKEIYSALQENQKEKMEMQHHYTESLASVKQLKLQVASLEEEVNSQELQYSGSLNAINELEIQVENLQKELENQAQAFEEDLDAVTQAKIMQEQRAIRAEEAFRKTRWNNANAAERLQEEFQRMLADRSSKIEESEKLVQVSVAEANDLRRRNEILEDLLQKARDEHQIKRDEYERTLHDLQEQTKGTWVKENEGLEKEVASQRKEAEELVQENISLKSQIDKAKAKEENLHLELKKLRQKNSEVKNNLLKLESEKENLKTEVSKLQIDLHNEKEERAALQNSIRSPVKAKNLMCRSTFEEESTTQKNLTDLLEKASAPAKDINDTPVEESSKGIDNLLTGGVLDTKHIERTTDQTMLEQKSDHLSGSCDTSSMLTEVVSLREKNKSMEERLKEMHERYSEISLRFAEVEGERQQLVMTLRNLKNGKKN
ncbi:Myosin heavy chain-related protein [Dorcoceras hygrometricum]|uniref:Myosin heavy chain-related protein n=1 Tax=Dorcoceras hygrometricum TaxID=472368 RepID=A0A2Z7CIY1_9LAMI|nr:Myosin heavy chain-related protein [Dorcoceras hygrometricum]